jgi:hypothetical protein
MSRRTARRPSLERWIVGRVSMGTTWTIIQVCEPMVGLVACYRTTVYAMEGASISACVLSQ